MNLERLLVSDYTGPGILVLVALLVITRRLVWFTDARKTEADRDYWRSMALDLLGVTEKLTVHGEVTNEILSSLPNGEGENP